MASEQDFLIRIVLEPFYPVHQAVFSDWLEEQEREREAEIVRAVSYWEYSVLGWFLMAHSYREGSAFFTLPSHLVQEISCQKCDCSETA